MEKAFDKQFTFSSWQYFITGLTFYFALFYNFYPSFQLGKLKPCLGKSLFGVECKEKPQVGGKEILQALHNALDGKCTEEELQTKITNFGLSLDREYELAEIIDKISATSSSTGMASEDETYEANWIEALRQLAEGLQDDEALQVIASAKMSMVKAHSQVAVNNDRSQPRDLNNNIVGSSGTSFDTIRRIDKEEEKRKETELLKILKDLKVEDEPLPLNLLEDDGNKKIEDEGKKF